MTSLPLRAFRHHVHGETRIEAPANAVWAVLSDFHGVADWAPLVTRVLDTGPTPNGVGAARSCTLRGLGCVDEVVVLWEEGERLGYRVTPLGPIGVSTSLWTLAPVDASATLVTLRLDYDLRFAWFGRLLHTLVARRLLERSLPGALALLKRRVETGRSVRREAAGPRADATRSRS